MVIEIVKIDRFDWVTKVAKEKRWFERGVKEAIFVKNFESGSRLYTNEAKWISGGRDLLLQEREAASYNKSKMYSTQICYLIVLFPR